MGIFSIFKRRQVVASQPPVYPVIQNFFTPGPGLSRILPSGETKDPNRLHATYYDELSWRTRFDEANPIVDRDAPRSELTQYLNEQVALPTPQVTIPAHGVMVPPLYMQHGWREGVIPDAGRRTDINVASPPVFLSRPISVRTIIKNSPPRSESTGAKAPKQKRAGGNY